jgi:flavin-dependent dehydrogenase
MGSPFKIGIIGAGPAGTFFALHLNRLASSNNREYQITLYDRKSFDLVGPRGCNMCAGAIGYITYKKIMDLGLELDDDVIRSILDGYIIHGRKRMAKIIHPDKSGIFTVFRGGGPIVSDKLRWKSFDQFLLDRCVGKGMLFVNRRVMGVEKVKIGESIKYRLAIEGESTREVDLLVGAFGVNSPLSKGFIPGYSPPKTWHTCQAELQVDMGRIDDPVRKMINIFSAQDKNIRFIAITPKDEYLTVSAIGEYVKISDLRRELQINKRLEQFLPNKYKIICHCHPQIAVNSATKPYDDSVAVVGDAFISRFLKNGIESAYETSRILAEAVITHGVSEDALRNHFYNKCLDLYHYDNNWGKRLFLVYERIFRKGFLSDLYIACVEGEGADASDMKARLTRVLWGVFAGDQSYKEIFKEACSFPTLSSFLKHTLFP